MIVFGTGDFSRFPQYLHKGDVLVLNNTKVLPARAWGKKEDKSIEFLFLEEKSEETWEVLCRPAKKVMESDIIIFSPSLQGQVVGVLPEGRRLLRFFPGKVIPELNKIGYAPLPPYIKRKPLQTELKAMDRER